MVEVAWRSRGLLSYAFTHKGIFCSLFFIFSYVRPPPLTQILSRRLKSRPEGPNPSLKVQIPAWRSKSQPQGPIPCLGASGMGFGPPGWDFDFQAGISASRLGFWPPGWDLGIKAGIWALRLGAESEGGPRRR